jgi:hypothetical protein
VTHEEDPRWWYTHQLAVDILGGMPGMEVVGNRDGYATQDIVVLAATAVRSGRIINVRYAARVASRPVGNS